MRRKISGGSRAALAALALMVTTAAGSGGCSSSTGLVLIFPNDMDKSTATEAVVLVVRPPAGGDDCPMYLNFHEPDGTNTELGPLDVTLVDGVAQGGLKAIPTGRQTLLVKFLDGSQNLFLHGCRTGSVESGDRIDITLVALGANGGDMQSNDVGVVDDLTTFQPDMAVHHFLSITSTELRDPSRRLMGTTVTITDSTGAGPAPAVADANGNVKIDVTGLVDPLTITANAAGVGAATLTGVTPVFTTNTLTVSLPVELDPPATSSVNNITLGAVGGAGNFDLYWISNNALYSDSVQLHITGPGPSPPPIPLPAGNFRVAVVESGTAMGTPAGITPAGGTFDPQATNLSNFDDSSFTVTTKLSTTGTYTASQQFYSAALLLPAVPNQAAVPIVSPSPLLTDGAMFTKNVPKTTLSMIQMAAQLVTEQTAITGTCSPPPCVRGEVRHIFSSTPASDSFISAVPEPPTIAVSPSPAPSATSFTITATPPTGFPLSGSFVHVNIHSATYHWHVVAPAANPTTIVVPGLIIPSGSYTMDVAFVQDFSLMDTTVQATLTDDYSKLIRPLPQELSQSTITLTVN